MKVGRLSEAIELSQTRSISIEAIKQLKKPFTLNGLENHFWQVSQSAAVNHFTRSNGLFFSSEKNILI